MHAPIFLPANILLPQRGADLERWAVMACDQFTSQPEYWEKVETMVGEHPSTLRIILPEVYLDGDTGARIKAIHTAMRDYRDKLLCECGSAFIYVERSIPAGVRQGLVGCVDLEAYSYQKNAQPRIRPSENTVVERIPPRLAARRGAVLESPHILMLCDDPGQTVIEPIAAKKAELRLVYDLDLMLGGGRLRGWAVTGAADIAAISLALAALEDEAVFNRRYGAAGITSPFALAVGDGNHSLATAKALWEEMKPGLGEAERQNHPARYCLVELENIQSPAIEIEPIHRVAFGLNGEDVLRAVDSYCKQNAVRRQSEGGQHFTLLADGKRTEIHLANAREPLAVGTVDAILKECERECAGLRVDYVHGEDAVAALADKGAVGLLLPPFVKADLFRGVALGGVLPKKTFSMGHAEEKRYYMECRAIL